MSELRSRVPTRGSEAIKAAFFSNNRLFPTVDGISKFLRHGRLPPMGKVQKCSNRLMAIP